MMVSFGFIALLFLLTLIAVFLFLTEIYFIPGLGIPGIIAAALSIAIFHFAFITYPPLAFCMLLIGVLIFGIGFYLLSRSSFIEKNSLKKTISGTTPNASLGIAPGMKGKASSRLNLTGKVFINDSYLEATSESGFIDADKDIQVTRIAGNKVFVKEI